MTTRTAEEAELSSADDTRRNPRARKEGNNRNDDIAMEEPNNALDVLTYITIPEEDPLHIHGWDSFTTTNNLNPLQATAWGDEQGAKLLTYKAGGGRLNNREEIIHLRDSLMTALETQVVPTIAPPSPENVRDGKDTHPVCSLIKGIQSEEAEKLLEMVRRWLR